ncbi:dTDP-4-dehydrorhamnose 3,5-epimerase [Roseibium sp. M-1]
MRLEATEIPDVLLVVPECRSDQRGYFVETYSKPVFRSLGISADFIQDNLSFSERQGTIRGLHFQTGPHAQSKLIRCARGAILDVAVDIRRGSPTFGLHVARVLSAENMHQLYIPKGFAHGFCTLTAATEIQYKVDAAYAPHSEEGIRFDDPDLAIDWRLGGEPAFVSERDRNLPAFTSRSAFTNAETPEVLP